MRRVRYLITGGSGYIGGRLTDELSAREETEKIVDVDLRPPPRTWQKHEFVKADIRDRKQMRELLERHEIDALLHFAFVLNPIRDEPKMYDIDVNGTQAVLQAAAEAGVKQAMVTSSVAAYGAFPDNPKPIAEDWPVRGVPDFSYAKDKADADRICQLWALEHPDSVMTIVRPAFVFGPNVDNYFIRAFENNPFMPARRWRRPGVPVRPRGRRRVGLDRAARRQARRRLQSGRRRGGHLVARGGDPRQEDATGSRSRT